MDDHVNHFQCCTVQVMSKMDGCRDQAVGFHQGCFPHTSSPRGHQSIRSVLLTCQCCSSTTHVVLCIPTTTPSRHLCKQVLQKVHPSLPVATPRMATASKGRPWARHTTYRSSVSTSYGASPTSASTVSTSVGGMCAFRNLLVSLLAHFSSSYYVIIS